MACPERLEGSHFRGFFIVPAENTPTAGRWGVIRNEWMRRRSRLSYNKVFPDASPHT